MPLKQARKLLRRVAAALGVTAVATRNIPFGYDWLLDVERLGQLWGRRNATFFDVGANDGTISLRILERFPAAEIHAFEPHPVVFGTLSLLGSRRGIRCHHVALSDAEGTATLHAPAYDKLSSLLPNAPAFRGVPTTTFEVRTTTIDAFCEAHGIEQIDVLKIDVEGFDCAVIRGASRMLTAGAISFVYVEFTALLRQGADESGVLCPIAEFLLPHGLHFIASFTEQVGSPDGFSLVSNALFALPPGRMRG